MSEELLGTGDGQERRSGMDRRSDEDRRRENLALRNVPPSVATWLAFFRSFLNRRSRKNRRSGQDRREAARTDS